MPTFVISLIIMIVSYALQLAFAPKQKGPTADAQDAPAANEGDKIPVVFGTVLRKDAQIAWWGDPQTSPIKADGGKK